MTKPDPVDKQALSTVGCGLAAAFIILVVLGLLTWGFYHGLDFLYGAAQK